MSINIENRRKASLQTLLKNIDTDFSPSVTEREGSVEKYIDKIFNNGRFETAYRNGDLLGFLTYIQGESLLIVDLAWVREDKRGSRTLRDLIVGALNRMPDDHLPVYVKIMHYDNKMINMVERIGFNKIQAIPDDFISGTTSLLYQISLKDLKKYFRCLS